MPDLVPDSAPGPAAADNLSQLLVAWARHDEAARDRLMPLVYDELHRLAHHYMRRERDDHTLQTTALVNEAYVRLAGISRLEGNERAQFFALAATIMRRILVDHARARRRARRGGGVEVIALTDSLADQAGDVPAGVDVIALNEALERLAALDAQQATVVGLRYFAGLTVEETAAALSISPSTVKREWAVAKAWLYRELTGTNPHL